MGISSIGGFGGFQPTATPLSSGPSAVQQTRQQEQDQTRRAEEEQTRQQTQQAGSTTATRGQNLNIVV